jgi:hypothetical protein
MTTDDLKVLSFQQWIDLLGISPSGGKRILKSKDAPPIVRLGVRRFGIRLADAKAHQDRCVVAVRKA